MLYPPVPPYSAAPSVLFGVSLTGSSQLQLIRWLSDGPGTLLQADRVFIDVSPPYVALSLVDYIRISNQKTGQPSALVLRFAKRPSLF